MKVAQFVNTLAVADGGPARNAFELNITLNQLPDITADLYSLRGGPEKSVVEGYSGEIGPLPVPGPRWLAARNIPENRQIGMRHLNRSLRNVDVVIIHGYYLPWLLPLTLRLQSMDIPYVITPHGALTQRQQQYSRGKKAGFDALVGSRIVRKSIGIVTGSPIEQTQVKEKFPDSNIEVGGVGTTLSPSLAPPHAWNDPVELLSMSRIAPKKRIDISIAAVAELMNWGVSVRLTVAGEGPRDLVNNLRELAHRLGVSDRVKFVGEVTGADKAAVYRGVDVFLLPSDDENFGIGLAEALAHGVPAVTTTAVAAARFMTTSSGRVLTQPTGADVAHAVQEILKGDRREYGMHALECANTNYAWPAVGKRWITALESLLLNAHPTNVAA